VIRLPGLEIGRVAEILIALGPNEPGRRGSGYRVTTQTVLTAAHVVRDWSMVRVRFDADQPGAWFAEVTDLLVVPEVDIALLTIRPPDHSRVVPARFGLLSERDDEIPCSAVGFPLWKLRDSPGGWYRDSAHVVGSVALLANRREGSLEVRVAPPERDPDPEVSPWEGMSGAAVFCDGRIVGVISKHHRSDGLGRLAASRADAWRRKVSAAHLRQMEARLGTLEWAPATATHDPRAQERSAGEGKITITFNDFSGSSVENQIGRVENLTINRSAKPDGQT
jgi:Trypsin-like peptidase domain